MLHLSEKVHAAHRKGPENLGVVPHATPVWKGSNPHGRDQRNGAVHSGAVRRGGCQNCRLRPSRTAGRNPYGSFGTNRCHFIKADVTREADAKGVIDVCVTKWGRVDCLFDNAGASTAGNGIETIFVEDFD